MAAVNWVRVHRSNFPTGNEEEDRHNVKIFSRDERGNWSVPDAKVQSSNPSNGLFLIVLTSTLACATAEQLGHEAQEEAYEGGQVVEEEATRRMNGPFSDVSVDRRRI